MLTHGSSTRTIWGTIGIFLLGLITTGTALAQQPAGPPGPPPRRESVLTPEDRAAMGQIFWHRLQQKIGLTDQQVTDIRALLDARRTAARADVQSLIAARRDLRKQLDQPTFDPDAIQATATKIKDLQGKLLDARLQTQLALRAKLTPEQWQQWHALRQETGHRWSRRGPGFGPGRM
jgi:Spy/CpxP family protein refolding chaperone